MTETPEPKAVAVRVEMDRRIHFAFQQNDVPVVKGIVVENLTGADLGPLALRVRSEPAFAKEWGIVLSGIAQGASCPVATPPIELSPTFLETLTERVKGVLRFEVGQPGRLLARQDEPVTLLAKDEWPGLGSLPEILAAFVLPNHPVVEILLREAARRVQKWTGATAMPGYQQSGPKRVAYQAAAIYETIRSCGLAYVNPPASFETEGQRIRLPDRVLRSKMATCLDVAVLAAACLEQAGLHPLVVIQKGHAFTGVWLQDECFPEPAVEDAHRLNKRVGLHEILVFDAVGATSKPGLDFLSAARSGQALLQKSEDFLCAIDVRRARIGGIRPMPERAEAAGGPAGATEAAAAAAAAKAPDLGEIPELPGEETPAPETPKTRLDRWSRKLLDLTLRNRMLHFRETQGTLRLLCPDLACLEDALAGGEEFRVQHRPAEYGASDPRSAEAARDRTGKDPLDEFLRAEMKERRLHSDLGPEELQKRLLKIYREARLGLEEGGASSLYLAVGFLSWYESTGHDQTRLAPILLLPVDLKRKSAREGFSVAPGDEEPRINVTLLEMLDKQFGIRIAGLDPLPVDESGLDVRKILQEIRKAVKDVPRWDVREDLVQLGLFSFSKFLMWRDLAEREEDLRRSAVVNHLIVHPNEPFPQAGALPDAKKIDAEKSPQGTYCPLSADSSQLAAVFAAAEGKSFVLHGPPGTGKSQTITNLICHCLASAKSVLFISEKMAALNVVHSRLKSLGLDRFCLELHSNKAGKAEVLRQLGQAFAKSGKNPQEPWKIEAGRIEELRGKLNAYAGALHLRRSTGETFFESLSRLAAGRGVPHVDLEWPAADSVDAAALAKLREKAERLATVATACGEIAGHPWSAATRSDWGQAFEEEARGARGKLRAALEKLGPAAAAIAKLAGMAPAAATPSPRPSPDGRGGAGFPHSPGEGKAETPNPKSLPRASDGESRSQIPGPNAGAVPDLKSGISNLKSEPPSAAGWSLKEIRNLAAFAVAFSQGFAPPAELVARADGEDAKAKAAAWVAHGRKRKELRERLSARYRKTVLGLDLEALRKLLARSRTSWWPFSWFRRQSVRKALREETNEGILPPASELQLDLDLALALRGEEKAIGDGAAEGKALFGAYWKEGEADWDEIEKVADWARKVRELALAVAGADLDRAARLRAQWGRLASEGKELLGEKGEGRAVLIGFLKAYKDFFDARAKVDEVLGTVQDAAWGREEAAGALGRAAGTLAAWAGAEGRLREWCAWREARGESAALRIAALAEGCERGRYRGEAIPAVFEKSFALWWTDAVGAAEPVLGKFFSPEHERTIQKFRDTDDRFRELTKDLVLARLEARAPEAAAADVKGSEMGILARELQKKSRHMSIRSLFQKITNLLPRLKPCLLMSPISVAQYLDAQHPPFDLVVFDEASQIPVWDAVGAIARGKQAVIVGDPKQLPPTMFFQRGDATEEEAPEEDAVEDLESILDDCLAARLPSMYLDWHYRSRHESLIAFSNARYYDGRLLTFPSPDPSGMGVSWRPVPEGVYDKSKTRTNRAEAEALVKEVVRRLKDPVLSRRSVGIVTFSQAQQELVEDLLEAQRQKDPSVDRFFAEDATERVFVKNLENVQGDERDAILFSVGYGPDRDGRVSMNFGPLNRDGGERRLNVAVTRARMEIVVFSTLRADQVDLNRTRARGVADLKAFLEYAEKGAAPAPAAAAPEAAGRRPVEEEAAKALRAKGWKVDERVGRSGYRVDLGVATADRPEEYVLGVEFDGPGYGNARTARDRDKLRRDVLEGLGWALHRVWAPDWVFDPAREFEKLEKALAAAVKAREKREREEAEAEAAAKARAQEEAAKAEADARDARGEEGQNAGGTAGRKSSRRAPAVEYEEPNAAEPCAVAEKGAALAGVPAYVPFPTAKARGTPEGFFEAKEDAKVRKALREIAEAEGPVSVALAARRAALLWGIDRFSKKVLARVTALLPGAQLRTTQSPEGPFLWPSKGDPRAYEGFRVPGEEDASCRSAEDLPPEEVANGVAFVLKRAVSLNAEDLCREAGKLFGFPRGGAKVHERMMAGIEAVVRKGLADRKGEVVTERAAKPV